MMGSRIQMMRNRLKMLLLDDMVIDLYDVMMMMMMMLMMMM